MALICNHGLQTVSLKELPSPYGTEKYLGFTKIDPFVQKEIITINELTIRVMISLGGYASEILFSESANIGGDDLTAAVRWIQQMMQAEEFRRWAITLPIPKTHAFRMIEDPTIRAVVDDRLRKCIMTLEPLMPVVRVIAEHLYKGEELDGKIVTEYFESFVSEGRNSTSSD